MEEIRYIRSDLTYADYSTSTSPAIEQALERKQSPGTIVLNIFSGGSFTIGVLEDPEKSLDLGYCRREGIVVRRRQNPGGAVWGPEGGGLIVFYLDTQDSWNPLKSVREGFQRTLTDLAGSLSELFSIPAVYRPLNDIEVEGRKLVATSARLERGILTMRLLINLVPTDPEILNKAIRMPPEKTQDKKIKEAGARFTCLEAEIGRRPTEKELTQLLNKTVEKIFGKKVALKAGRLTEGERQYAEEYRQKYTSDAWFYANSEKIRFPSRPAGSVISEGRHKAPAGLIRVTLLLYQSQIEDLIITGDFHPSPFQVIQDMEAALKGKEGTLEGIGYALKRVLDRPGVEIPGTTVEDFLSAFSRAFGPSNPMINASQGINK